MAAVQRVGVNYSKKNSTLELRIAGVTMDAQLTYMLDLFGRLNYTMPYEAKPNNNLGPNVYSVYYPKGDFRYFMSLVKGVAGVEVKVWGLRDNDELLERVANSFPRI